MADIRAFRGFRYDLSKTGALTDVIAPPYDVIDDALSKKLHDLNPANVIRVILNPIKPTDTDADNRYTRSAKILKDWIRDGVLTEENEPSLYIYFQTFDWEGRTYTRRGFMSRTRLEPFGKGKIYPHEETLSGPKADRLKLFHATKMNLSQIFGLYPDESNAIADRLSEIVRGKTPLEATDHLGVRHQMWAVSDPTIVTELQGLLGPKPIFIADGHHRYETGCRHLEDCEAAGQNIGPDHPARFILMMLVGMSDPGLRVMPTHRLLSGIRSASHAEVAELLAPHFDVRNLGTGKAAGEAAWKQIEQNGAQNVLAFNTPSDDHWLVATLRSASSMDAIVTDHSAGWKALGVSILHRLAIDHCLKDLGKPQFQYVHLTSEVFDAVQAKTCQLACLVHPATVDHIRQIAGTFEKMPAKSTYFYPKLASGLLFNPIG